MVSHERECLHLLLPLHGSEMTHECYWKPSGKRQHMEMDDHFIYCPSSGHYNIELKKKKHTNILGVVAPFPVSTIRCRGWMRSESNRSTFHHDSMLGKPPYFTSSQILRVSPLTHHCVIVKNARYRLGKACQSWEWTSSALLRASQF